MLTDHGSTQALSRMGPGTTTEAGIGTTQATSQMAMSSNATRTCPSWSKTSWTCLPGQPMKPSSHTAWETSTGSLPNWAFLGNYPRTSPSVLSNATLALNGTSHVAR